MAGEEVGGVQALAVSQAGEKSALRHVPMMLCITLAGNNTTQARPVER